MAVELGLTVTTIRTYRKLICKKFDVSGLGWLLALIIQPNGSVKNNFLEKT